MKTSTAQDAFAKGLAFLALRDHLLEAEAAFREGIAADPHHTGCLIHLGATLRNLGRLKEAERTLLQARSLAPDDPVVHMQIGTLMREQKRWSEALGAYDAALALDPAHVNTRVARTIALQDMSRLQEALAQFDALIEELPEDLVEACALRRRRASVVSAVDELKDQGIDPSLPPQPLAASMYRRANHLAVTGSLHRAVSLYSQVAAMRPDYGDPTFPIGETVEAQRALRPSGMYLSCGWIEGCVHFHHHRLAFCCNTHAPDRDWPVIGPYHGGPIPIDYLLARRRQLTEENQTGIQNACFGCPELTLRAWPLRPWVFDRLIINTHTVCNQRCSFCFLAQADFDMPDYYYPALPPIEGLMARGWLAPDTYVLWGGGEPTLSREFLELWERLLSHGCRLNLYSNATRLDPPLLASLRMGRCDYVTSADSGTPETFYRIKYVRDKAVTVQGRPAFEVVWEHIGICAEAAPEHVIVKYIVTQENFGDADVDGFIDLCRSHRVANIMLLTEVCEALSGEVAPGIWRAAERLARLALESGIRLLFSPSLLRTAGVPPPLIQLLEHAQPSAPLPDGLDAYRSIMGIAVAHPHALAPTHADKHWGRSQERDAT